MIANCGPIYGNFIDSVYLDYVKAFDKVVQSENTSTTEKTLSLWHLSKKS